MNELIEVEKIQPLTIFTEDGIDPILKQITKQVRAFESDISTAKGRKDIASLANKVARSKTLLDGMGKDLVSDWKSKSKAVDNSRKKLRDTLDDLKVEARQPLTDWEDEEKDRVQNHRDAIDKILFMTDDLENLNSKEINYRLESLVNDVSLGPGWEEFQAEAQTAYMDTEKKLKTALDFQLKVETDQAELERLRELEEARKQREHEERIAKEAADKARAEAEEKAECEAVRLEEIRIEAEKKAQTERDEAARKQLEETTRIENARLKAIADKEMVERRAVKDKQEAEQRAKDAEKKRLADIEQAKRDEQDRIAKQKAAEENEARRREADIKHRKKINNEALSAMVESSSVTSSDIRPILEAIIKGEIPHVKITY